MLRPIQKPPLRRSSIKPEALPNPPERKERQSNVEAAQTQPLTPAQQAWKEKVEQYKGQKPPATIAGMFPKTTGFNPTRLSFCKEEQEVVENVEENKANEQSNKNQFVSTDMFLEKIATMIGQSDFWKKQGEGILGIKITPTGIIGIDKIFKENLSTPHGAILGSIFAIAKEKVEKIQHDEAKYQQLQKQSPTPTTSFRSMSARGGILFADTSNSKIATEKLKEIAAYKASKQYQIYKAIDDYRIAIASASQAGAHKAYETLKQIISAPDSNPNPAVKVT